MIIDSYRWPSAAFLKLGTLGRKGGGLNGDHVDTCWLFNGKYSMSNIIWRSYNLEHGYSWESLLSASPYSNCMCKVPYSAVHQIIAAVVFSVENSATRKFLYTQY